MSDTPVLATSRLYSLVCGLQFMFTHRHLKRCRLGRLQEWWATREFDEEGRMLP